MVSKTNTLIILGNGFDLNCSLDSKFSDFFKDKLNKITLFLNNHSQPFLPVDNIWYLFFYFAFYDSKEREERLFLKINKNEIFWMDVESLIKAVVSDIKSISSSYKSQIVIRHGGFIPAIQYAYKNNRDYIDGSSAQFNLLKEFFNGKNLANELNIYSFLYEQLRFFEKEFKEYIIECVKTNNLYNEKAMLLLSELVSPGNTYSLISFNYTMPFLSKLDSKISCNIHGTISNDIIIGYDSSSDSDDSKCIQLSKAWQKMNLVLPQYKLPGKTDIKCIKIYGHSLGPQDYSYFHAIFDYYNIYDGDVVLEFCYSSYGLTNEENNLIRSRFISSVYKLLRDYTVNSGKESKVRTIISKLQIENRLKIKEIKNLQENK